MVKMRARQERYGIGILARVTVNVPQSRRPTWVDVLRETSDYRRYTL